MSTNVDPGHTAHIHDIWIDEVPVRPVLAEDAEEATYIATRRYRVAVERLWVQSRNEQMPEPGRHWMDLTYGPPR